MSLFALPRRTTALHGLFDQYSGLMTVEEKAAAILEGIGDDAAIQLNSSTNNPPRWQTGL